MKNDLEKSAQKYSKVYGIDAINKSQYEAFKAGAMWERERIKDAWPSGEDINDWMTRNLNDQSFGDFRHFFKFHMWLRERILGGAE